MTILIKRLARLSVAGGAAAALLLGGLSGPAQAADTAGGTGAVPKVSASAKAAPGPALKGSVPKGQPGLVASPPKASKSALAGGGGPFYHYTTGLQNFTTAQPTILQFNANVIDSYLDTDDYHTLIEGAAIKSINTSGTAKRNIVEIGHTVDPSVFGGSYDPHLFIFWWKDGVGACYNLGCGFVPYTYTPAAPYSVGMNLAGSGPMTYGIQYSSGDWWLYAAAVGGTKYWLGYYPGTLWSTANAYGPAVTGFNNMSQTQVFGELAAGNVDGSGNEFPPCSDIGRAKPDAWSTSADTQYVSSVTYNTGATAPSMSWITQPTTAGYGVGPIAPGTRSAWIGGPGADSSGNYPGNDNWC